MNVQQLNIIIELAKGKTLLEIAKKLELTQPTVSFHIKKLEEELGLPLVIKQSRNLRITDACVELVPYAKQILELMEQAKNRMNEIQGITKPKLRISASYTPATFYIPPFLKQFQESNPNVQIVVSVNQAKKSLELLRNHQIDVAIVSLPYLTIEGFNVHPITKDNLLIVFSPENRLASLSNITTQDLSMETFLLHDQHSTSRKLMEEWVNTTNIKLQSTMELGAIDTIKEAVKSNMGIGVLPARSVQQEIESGTLHAIELPDFDYHRYICLVYRNEDNLPAYVSSFVWFAIENMK